MKKVKKAVIPAAGLGTRFLPFTKSIPKEMLPIVDKPTIQYIIEELVESGIEDILIINGRNKVVMVNHFDSVPELEIALKEAGKMEQLEEVENISQMANIFTIRQKKALGLGHAILKAKDFVDDEPFAILLGDDVIYNRRVPAIKQLIDAYNKVGTSVVGVQQVPWDDVSKYGIVSVADDKEQLTRINSFVEKPALNEAPSNLAIVGRYILMPEIFPILEKTRQGAGSEIQLTDALITLNKSQPIYAYDIQGRRYDLGNKQGFLEATVEYGLRRDDLSDDFYRYIKNLIGNNSLEEVLDTLK